MSFAIGCPALRRALFTSCSTTAKEKTEAGSSSDSNRHQPTANRHDKSAIRRSFVMASSPLRHAVPSRARSLF